MKIIQRSLSILILFLCCALKSNCQVGMIVKCVELKQDLFKVITNIKKIGTYQEENSASYRIGSYMNSENIIFNDDAIKIFYSLNKKIIDKGKLMSEDDLKSILFPQPADSLTVLINEELKTARKVDSYTNQLFLNNTFKYKKLYKNAQMGMDSLFNVLTDELNNKIIPIINLLADSIPKIHMEYFNDILLQINALLPDVYVNKKVNYSKVIAVYFLILDIKQNEIVRQNLNKVGMYFKNKSFPYVMTSFINEAYTTDPYAIPNANIYVYRANSNGKINTNPEMNAFYIYYGPNGLKYSLTANCDTLSFFKNHPLNPASTLPILLAAGNYCFILQDIHTKKLYFRSDINLNDNLVYDVSRVVKLPFLIED